MEGVVTTTMSFHGVLLQLFSKTSGGHFALIADGSIECCLENFTGSIVLRPDARAPFSTTHRPAAGVEAGRAPVAVPEPAATEKTAAAGAAGKPANSKAAAATSALSTVQLEQSTRVEGADDEEGKGAETTAAATAGAAAATVGAAAAKIELSEPPSWELQQEDAMDVVEAGGSGSSGSDGMAEDGGAAAAASATTAAGNSIYMGYLGDYEVEAEEIDGPEEGGAFGGGGSEEGEEVEETSSATDSAPAVQMRHLCEATSRTFPDLGYRSFEKTHEGQLMVDSDEEAEVAAALAVGRTVLIDEERRAETNRRARAATKRDQRDFEQRLREETEHAAYVAAVTASLAISGAAGGAAADFSGVSAVALGGNDAPVTAAATDAGPSSAAAELSGAAAAPLAPPIVHSGGNGAGPPVFVSPADSDAAARAARAIAGARSAAAAINATAKAAGETTKGRW
ncbi:unnamed protein product, partial [Phaeothamnion confervicola]